MTRFAMSIDLDRCIGCQSCTVACKAGNERPQGDNYIQIREIERGQMPNLSAIFAHRRCFHCAEAACVSVCPTGALSKAANGLTAVDHSKCNGCRYCASACPFSIPTQAEGRVSKCVGCLDVTQEGGVPYCVQTCPSEAIKFGERDTLLAEAKTRVAALKARYPNAQVYGENQLGGLGLLMILLDRPEVYSLSPNPRLPSPLYAWQMAHPFSLPVAALASAFTGLAFVIARREHAKEKAEMATRADTPAESTPDVAVATAPDGTEVE